jgi:hypothetical protein
VVWQCELTIARLRHLSCEISKRSLSPARRTRIRSARHSGPS